MRSFTINFFLSKSFIVLRLGGGGSGLGNSGGKLGGGSLLLVEATDGKGGKGLHHSGSVVGSRGISEAEHGLGELSVELGVGVSEDGLNVDELLEVVEGSVHLDDGDVLSKVLLLLRGKLHSGCGGGKLGLGGDPVNVGALVEEEGGVEVSDTVLLDAPDTEGLLVFGVELSGEDLNDHVGVLLLGIDEGVKVGLTGLDGSHDGLEGVTTLLHVTLDLPVELDIGGDVKVEGKVKKVTDALVVHGVKSLNDDDGGRLDGLRGVKGSVHVVVDGLLNGLSVLEGLDLLEHQVKVVLLRVEGGEARNLTALTVVGVVVIEADNGGEVRHEGVSLPSSVAESTSEGSNNISSEGRSQPAHEGRLSAARVSGDSNDKGSLAIGKSSELRDGGGRLNSRLEGDRSESGSSGDGEGKGSNSLHDCTNLLSSMLWSCEMKELFDLGCQFQRTLVLVVVAVTVVSGAGRCRLRCGDDDGHDDTDDDDDDDKGSARQNHMDRPRRTGTDENEKAPNTRD